MNKTVNQIQVIVKLLENQLNHQEKLDLIRECKIK
jgi:hypothetical protein